jgi:ABC-type Mn2+/Zn2+ transport system permease subunit
MALVATLVGTWLAASLHRASGPVIVVVAAACFVLALMNRRGATMG